MFFIRTAGPKDVEPVRKLLAETWHATYDPIHGPLKVGALVTSLHSAEAILKRINLKDGEFLVADDGKRIGGMGFAAMSPTMTPTTAARTRWRKASVSRGRSATSACCS